MWTTSDWYVHECHVIAAQDMNVCMSTLDAVNIIDYFALLIDQKTRIMSVGLWLFGYGRMWVVALWVCGSLGMWLFGYV